MTKPRLISVLLACSLAFAACAGALREAPPAAHGRPPQATQAGGPGGEPARVTETRGRPLAGDRAVTRRTDTLNASAPSSAPRFRRLRRFNIASWDKPRVAAPRPASAPVLHLNAAQTVDVNFLGAQFVDDSTDVPPDSMGAIGPTQFLLGVNGRVRTFTKTGTADGVIDTTLDNFFAALGGNSTGVADPRVRYDRFTSRWFVTAISAPPTGSNRILIARSSGPTIAPSTTWSFFSIQAAAGEFLDFDTLGIDEDALYIGAMVFDALTGEALDTSGFVVRKSSVLGSGPIVVTKFASLIDLDAELGLFAPLGVDNFDSGTNAGYFIAVDVFRSGQLDVMRVSNPGGTPSLSPVIAVPTAQTTLPVPVEQPPPGPSLDALDYPRLTNAVIRSGRLWTAHHYEMDSSGSAAEGTGRNGVRWYELTNLGGTPSVRQSGTIFDPSDTTPMSYWMPSVMVSGQGHAAFGFSRAGADPVGGFASAVTTGRLAQFPLNTAAAPEVYGSSAFLYDPPDPANPLRWGDYSYTSLDPTDDMTMWTVQEYTSAPDRWGVRVAKLLAPAPVITSVTTVPTGATHTGITVKGTGFFDPGSGFSKRPSASASGGVQIHGVVATSPTEVVLDATTAGATPGDKTVNVTNPDGQSVSATLVVTGAAPRCSSCSDFNADGDQDVLWHNRSTGQISAWLLNSTQFVSSTSFGGKGASLAWKPAATADFNADGKPDILWHNSSTGAASIWFMHGDRFIASSSITGHAPASPVWLPAATADFNGDGKTDVLWHNRNTGQISTWLLNGTQFVQARSFTGNSSASTAWTPISAPDFTGDAKSDILWHNKFNGQISAWIMNGMQFVRATSFSGNSSASLAWTPVASVDFNGDAKPDILWHNRNTGQISAWIMNGTQFAGSTAFGGRSSASLPWTPVG